MNRQRLHDIAAHTRNVNDTEIAEIKQLIGRFPFYALPHMVLAKIFYEKEHYLFENALTQAAMRVPDRAALYHYINGEKTDVAEADTDETFDIPQTESNPVVTEEVSELETASEAITENPEPEELIESRNNLSDFLEEPLDLGEMTPTAIPEELPVLLEEESVAEINAEESDIPMEIIEESPVINVSEVVEEEIPAELEIKEQENSEDLSEAEEEAAMNIALNLRKHPVYNVEEFLQNSEEEHKQKAESEERDFFYWLRHPKQEDIQEEQAPEPDIQPQPDERLSIIDQFIRSNPAISRPKKEFFNAENMAKKSEYLDLDFVSETLANIYYEQGNIDLAIKAYEKLSLQNPLKQAYFATLIEKIKKEKR